MTRRSPSVHCLRPFASATTTASPPISAEQATVICQYFPVSVHHLARQVQTDHAVFLTMTALATYALRGSAQAPVSPQTAVQTYFLLFARHQSPSGLRFALAPGPVKATQNARAMNAVHTHRRRGPCCRFVKPEQKGWHQMATLKSHRPRTINI